MKLLGRSFLGRSFWAGLCVSAPVDFLRRDFSSWSLRLEALVLELASWSLYLSSLRLELPRLEVSGARHRPRKPTRRIQDLYLG